jgi:hypothetical protein
MGTRTGACAAGWLAGWLALSTPWHCQAADTGFRAEVGVRESTGLDWEFVAGEFGADPGKVSVAYDPRKQRYQLFVPPAYKPGKFWPLVVFVSPGDDPLGWRTWRRVCEGKGILFCAAYGAGNDCPPAQRVRILLDVLDDVRARYRVDPDRTYLTGIGGGSRLACTLAFSLPEYFGGVVAVGGVAPLNRLAYLRWRVQDRLSVALVAGERARDRRELADYAFPLLRDLGVRTRLWEVKGGDPGPGVLAEAYAWLEADRKRRLADARAFPAFRAPGEGTVRQRLQAARALELAEEELRRPDRAYRGVALLEGIVARWERTEAGEKAQKELGRVRADPSLRRRVAEQASAEMWRVLSAQARAFERAGQVGEALKTWEALAKAHAEVPAGAKAGAEVKRLKEVLARTPYLGVAFEGGGTTVREVVPGGPARRAGLRAGDRVVRVGGSAVGSLDELRKRVGGHRPGDELTVEVRRGGKAHKLTVRLGAVPAPGE